MKLPQFDRAIVARSKVVRYLLSSTHPEGRTKAVWFGRFGFKVGAWQVLARALRDHAWEQELESVEESVFGRRYTIAGPLRSPDGRTPTIRSVWFVEAGRTIPRLVTAYPAWRRRS